MTPADRIAALEARLAAAEARIAALEMRTPGYPPPGLTPAPLLPPAPSPPGWPWYEVTCKGTEKSA